MEKERRYYELDSLRGVAALTVVFHHFMMVLPSVGDDDMALWYLKFTPLHLFWSGHEAVIFFFVLSGFVLSLQFFGKRVYYTGYFIKRICRIYLPYLAAVTAAVICAGIFYRGPNPNLSHWFNSVWATSPSLSLIEKHLEMLPDFNNGAFDPVLWSLVHEMRISLIFPLIMVPIIRFNWKVNAFLAGLCSITGMALHYVAKFRYHVEADYFMTIHFIGMFMVGALLAKHKTGLVRWYQALSQRGRTGLVLLAIPCYLFAWVFHSRLVQDDIGWLPDWVISFGVSIFILAAIGSDKIGRVLGWRAAHFLGRTSYSIYLFHAIVLLCITQQLYDRVPLVGIWVLALAITIAISALSFKYVELPSIAVGKALSDWSRKLWGGAKPA